MVYLLFVFQVWYNIVISDACFAVRKALTVRDEFRLRLVESQEALEEVVTSNAS